MELKPCPFCGDVKMHIRDAYGDLFVICGRCGARTRFTTTQKEAVDAWQQRDTRAERTCRIKEDADTGFLTCSECGAIQPEEWTVYYCWSCGAKVVGA